MEGLPVINLMGDKTARMFYQYLFAVKRENLSTQLAQRLRKVKVMLLMHLLE